MRLRISTVLGDGTDAVLPSVRGVIFEVEREDEVSYQGKVVDVTGATARTRPSLGAIFGIPKAYVERGIAEVLP